MSVRTSVPLVGERPHASWIVSYDGDGRELLRIVALNTALAILTLTIYRFWGKTRVRSFLWSGVRFLGERIEYAGRPMELFVGFIAVVVVFVPFVIIYDLAVGIWLAGDFGAALALEQLYPLIFFALIQFAVYRARRYRLSRTFWRGIRAGQTGSALAYSALSLLLLILVIVTIGIAFPVRGVMLYRYRMRHTWFGDRCFSVETRIGPLFGIWMLCWILLVPTLGISYVWYHAAEIRYFARTTRYDRRLAFASSITGGRLFRAYLPYVLAALIGGGAILGVNVAAATSIEDGMLWLTSIYPFLSLIVFLTIWGIAQQMVAHRFVRLFCDTLAISGSIDVGEVRQNPAARSRYGEGLADALDVGGL